ncbi:MAG TPA: head GIN domain-containing protein [Gammaproteobacteria bacterium]|nr:head GIN domain-containing protein [Gammaproteobacteria bacterium]
MRISGSIRSVGLAVFACVLAGCESQAQQRESELRELSGFTGIHAGGGIDLHVLQGADFRVEITEGDPADLVTEVSGTTLEIHPRRGLGGFFNWGAGHEVSVTLPVLETLRAGGGTDVEVSGEIGGESLQLASSGGSDIEIRVAVRHLEVDVSGGSDVDLSGTADSATLKASGGSDLDAAGFRVRDARVESSGGSDIVIGVEERLSGSASGGSDIVYSGNPRTVDVDTSGGSDLTRR